MSWRYCWKQSQNIASCFYNFWLFLIISIVIVSNNFYSYCFKAMLLKLTAVLVFIHIINSPQYLLQIFPCSFTVSSQQENHFQLTEMIETLYRVSQWVQCYQWSFSSLQVFSLFPMTVCVRSSVTSWSLSFLQSLAHSRNLIFLFLLCSLFCTYYMLPSFLI